ncbi:MAG: hypothetical protein JWR20_2270, partial [Marmoricola sp.]|nr:hypothetical protein [Marmoricola sp.]
SRFCDSARRRVEEPEGPEEAAAGAAGEEVVTS